MSLIDLLLESTLGRASAPSGLSLALFSGSRELTPNDGYVRATVRKGSWQVEAESATIKVRFGPFTRACTFDRVRLIQGSNRTVEEIMLAGPATAPAGLVFEYAPSFTFAKVNAP